MTAPGNFAPSPLHGAAYKTMLERCDINNCSSPEARAAIEATLVSTTAWAAGEQLPVRTAYEWAVSKVRADADSRMKIFENSRKVFAAYDSIPKPPLPNGDGAGT